MVRGRSAPVRLRKIRNWYFSDLRWRNEKTGYAQHIHMPRICICDTYTNQSGRHILHICTHTSCMISRRNIHAHSFDI
ncbi:TPA: hypothetical protein MH332_26095 [Klebsiella pneumoniae]|nr:hypothetical protein [Klebsiella pneumoniae]HBY4307594.1 hypothetical protein [Klebsiella pneumoniae]